MAYWDQFPVGTEGGPRQVTVPGMAPVTYPGGGYNTGTVATAPVPGGLQTLPGSRYPTTPSAGPNQPQSGGPRGDPLQIMQQASQGLAPTAQSLQQLVNALHQAGYTDARIATHAGGQPSGDKIEIPSQGIGWDVIRASDSPQAAWQFGGSYNIAGGGPTGGPSGNLSSMFGSFSGAASPMGGAATDAPLLAPWNTPFVPPTDVTEQNDPGYQFRLQQGLQGVERGVAGRGTLLTGGTLKDLTQYAQNYASNEYQNVYNRALQQYGLGYDIFNQNQQNQYNRLMGVATLGENAAAQSGYQGQGYSNLAGNLYQNIGNANAASTIGQGNAYSNMITNLGQLGPYYASMYRGYNPGPQVMGPSGGYYGPTPTFPTATFPDSTGIGG